ncbi:hypothetical protein B1H10_00275 [candidate division KSB1 bacterium 4484_188]|nr:MAG: hypothetical protein B1H10_00275 [candidate division KSB1 bacterium 4484_188]
MEVIAVEELIKHLEYNFNSYIQLLNRINRDDLSENSDARAKLISFFSTLTAVEDEVIEFRLKKIVEEKNPYLPAINPKKLTESYLNQNLSLAKIRQEFLQQRKMLLNLVHRIPNEYWNRTGVHASEGHVPFKEFVWRMVKRDKQYLSHLSQFVAQTAEQ